MIFRRGSRDESFQRQIDDLRQKPGESEHDEDDYRYEFDDEDEPSDTSRYSTERDTQSEGISFPSSRSEASAATADEASQPTSPPMAPPAPETTRWQAPSDDSTSIIAVNAHWNGTLRTEGPLRVHGKADGELHSTSDLYVAEGAEVDAELHAESVVVAGLVRGRIQARNRLEVLPQGEVTGDVHSPKLVVHEGATLSGQLKMEAADGRNSGTPESRASATLTES